MNNIKDKRDNIAVISILLLCITAIAGILSMDYSHTYEIANQYGHMVKIYGNGIYAFDTNFKAAVSIGSDFCILFVLVPMFVYSYRLYYKKGNSVAEMELISVYGVVLYYAASVSLGVTYNRLFLIYVALFSCSLFGMFRHIWKVKWSGCMNVTAGLKTFLILSGLSLFVAWLPDIIPTIINGGTLSSIGVYTTEITYVLDMGIVSPLCFVCLWLLMKKKAIGTMILAIILKACIVVGIMMIPQTICIMAAGIEMTLPVLVTKTLSFILLAGFAFYFERKMKRYFKEEEEIELPMSLLHFKSHNVIV